MFDPGEAAEPNYVELTNGMLFDQANNFLFFEPDNWESALYLGDLYNESDFFIEFPIADLWTIVDAMEIEASIMGVGNVSLIRDTYLGGEQTPK